MIRWVYLLRLKNKTVSQSHSRRVPVKRPTVSYEWMRSPWFACSGLPSSGERESTQSLAQNRHSFGSPYSKLHRISSNGVCWPERALLRGSVNDLCGLNSEDAVWIDGLPEGRCCVSGKCGRMSSVSSFLWTRRTKTPHQRLNRRLAIQINIYRF